MSDADLEPQWPDIIRIFLSGLSVFLAFGMLLPIFPVWVSNFTDSMTMVGVATTLSAGVGLVAARPIAAKMMEGRTRMPAMGLGAFCVCFSAACFPFIEQVPAVDPFLAILFFRAIGGLGFGLVTTAAVSAITDLTPFHRRGEVLGYFGASNALALLLGPLIGGLLDKTVGVNYAFWIAGALAVPALYFAALAREPKAAPIPPGSYTLVDALKFPAPRIASAGHFLAVMLHGALLAFGPLLFDERDGWMSVEIFFAVEAAAVIAFRIAIGKRVDLYDRLHFVRFGLAAMVVSGVLMGLVQHDLLFMVVAIVYGIGFSAYVPTMNAMIGDIVPSSHRARGFAIFMLAFDLAIAGGGVIVGPIADGDGGPQRALMFAGLAPLLALFIYMWGTRRLRIEMKRR